MRDVEKIKQEIILELENVRLYGSFFLPGLAVLASLLFTNKTYPDNVPARGALIFGMVIVEAYFYLIRAESIRKIKEKINKL